MSGCRPPCLSLQELQLDQSRYPSRIRGKQLGLVARVAENARPLKIREPEAQRVVGARFAAVGYRVAFQPHRRDIASTCTYNKFVFTPVIVNVSLT
jgi:hypothetical protein